MFKAKVIRTKVGKGAAGLFGAFRGPDKVLVGFPSGEADSDVIERAVYNNFGTSRGIPERPFMQNAMRNHRREYQAMMKTEARNIVLGAVRGQDASRTKVNALKRLGIKAQGDIQAEITSLDTPPNAPSTIRQKGSSNPLIDTGEMRNSVSYKIED
ncbi:Hypothetical protein NGAL_HAMBI2605_10380 [Neorhizobium galegae bv. orientalis]|nr:Hypothetical protein NGAL_HAMBI2605_10380 [Neorhizobium galegae bv. orientalis]